MSRSEAIQLLKSCSNVMNIIEDSALDTLTLELEPNIARVQAMCCNLLFKNGYTGGIVFKDAS